MFDEFETLKTTLDAWRLLDNVVHLTGHKDRQALERHLVNTLAQLISAEEIGLYDSHVRHGERVFTTLARVEGENTSGAGPRAGDEVLLRCIAERKEVILTSAEGVDVAFPVSGPDGMTGVLALRCIEFGARDRDLLLGFLLIYQNYLALLVDTEHDTLTGLYNRRKLELKLAELMMGTAARLHRRECETERGYCLALLDIDHFKGINDRFGHLYGDEVLLLFAQLMRKSFREDDLLFRYGGEEFIVLLENVEEQRARTVLDRFRQAVHAHSFPQVGTVTVSIGFVQVTRQGMPSDVFSQADRALYYGKEHGRNRVCGFEELVRERKLADQDREEGSIDLF
ncbi:MAG: GGDEF domain-containing protein [Gammaproteobacteria bacterium]